MADTSAASASASPTGESNRQVLEPIAGTAPATGTLVRNFSASSKAGEAMKVPPPQPPSDPSGAPPPTALDGPPTAAVLADGAGAGAGAGAGPQHSAAEGPAESEDAFFSKAQGVAMGMLVRAVDKVQVTFSMRQLRNAVVVLAAIQAVVGFFTVVTAGINQASTVDIAFSAMSGIVAVIGGGIGIHGARLTSKVSDKNQDRGRGELLFFSILEYWGLTTFTTYLFTGVRDNVTADSASCQRAAVGLARRVIEGCDSGGAWSGVRIACAVIMLIAAIVGGYCSYQLKEQVQDSEMKQHIKKTVKHVASFQGSAYFKNNASFRMSTQLSQAAAGSKVLHNLDDIPEVQEVAEEGEEEDTTDAADGSGEGYVDGVPAAGTPISRRSASGDEPAVMHAVDKILLELSGWFTFNIARRVKAVKILCYMQMVLSITAVVIVLVLADASVVQNAFMAAVSVAAAVLGILGASKRDRGAIFLFFVFELWGLSTVTTYLLSGVKSERAVALTCSQTLLADKVAAQGGSAATTSGCDSIAVTWIRIVVSLIMLVVTLFSCYASMRLDDNIQSDTANKRHSEAYLDAAARMPATRRVSVGAALGLGGAVGTVSGAGAVSLTTDKAHAAAVSAVMPTPDFSSLAVGSSRIFV